MAKKALLISSSVQSPNGASGAWNNINNIASAYIKGIQTGNLLNTINAQTLQALISGVPSPWARAKLFKYALDCLGNPATAASNSGLNQYYKILVGEWKGLLAVMALYPGRITFSAPLSLSVNGNLYDIASAFGRMLFEDADIWSNQSDLAQNPGTQPFIQLIYYRGKLVGGTSPLTAVFTGVDYSDLGDLASDIPWYRNGVFEDPDRYLEPQQLQKLYHFVKNMNTNAQSFDNMVNSQRGNKPKINFAQFQSVGQNWEQQLLKKANGALQPVGPIAKYNNLEIPFKLLFDSNVPLYRTPGGTFTFTNAPGVIQIGDINSLLSDDKFVIGWSEDSTTAHSLYDSPVFLLKVHELNEQTAHYFSLPLSEQAIDIFRNSLPGILGYAPGHGVSMEGKLNDKGQLVVMLTLQVDGHAVQLNPKEYEVQWQLRPQKVILWPNFIANEWTRYYIYSQRTDASQPEFLPFFKDKNSGGVIKDRFGKFLTSNNLANADMTAPTVSVRSLVKTPADAGNTLPADYEISLIDTPVLGLKAMVTQGVSTICAGYLITRQDVILDYSTRQRSNTATVGFDFGSNNTCVFYHDSQSNQTHPICFKNYRAMLVGQETMVSDRVAELDELLFFSNYESNNGQFKSWLQEHDGRTNQFTQMDEIAGGVPVNRPNVQVNKMTDRIIETQAGVLHYNMKWLNDNLGLQKKRAFIKSLWLQTCAYLFTNDILPTSIKWSYPGAMMMRDVNDLHQIFLALGNVTPLQMANVTVENGMTEAEAVCSYAVGLPDFGLAANSMFLGIDVGGSTSDILLLARDAQNNGQPTLFTESSIRLAAGVFFNTLNGSGVGSQQFRNALVTFHGGHNTSVNVMNINEITRPENRNKAPYYLNCIFDQLKPEEYDIFYQSLAGNARFVFTIPAYVTGGLLFYSGMLIGKALKTGKLPETLQQVDILPFGKGGRLFHWLYQAVGQQSTDSYYGECLNAGIKCIINHEVRAVLRSQIAANNKTEVARGLCEPTQQFVKTAGLSTEDICGEQNVYFRNGSTREPIATDQTLDGKYFHNPSQFELTELENFSKFMDMFLNFVCHETNVSSDKEQQMRRDLQDLPGCIANFITGDPEYQKALNAGQENFPYHQSMIVTEIAAYLQKMIQQIF
ncbi:hypothetical protein [uncultured Prevotella sp.]|uniref:hypothetical protein n=1 Tax=uncultured Prevotella sp. TaxID=159272 RepID=UPI0027DC88A7|nr:hypothetical protein [uncultured Prevotella sp.]